MERHLASLLAAYPADSHAVPAGDSGAGVSRPQFFGMGGVRGKSRRRGARASALGEAGIDVRPDEPPTNVGIAGQSGLSVGAIAVDPNQPRACWLWMAPTICGWRRKTRSRWRKESL